MDLKEARDSVIRESYNILIEFGILMKPVRPIKAKKYVYI
jgi:hypothetical protein